MKKWIVLLAVLLLLTAMAIPAWAAETEIAVTASSVTVYPGAEITITVSVSGDTPYTSVGVSLSYDSQVLEFVRAEGADTGAMAAPEYDGVNAFGVVYPKDKPSTYSGVLQKIVFRVKKNAPLGVTKIDGTPNVQNSNLDGDKTIASVFKAVEITVNCRHNYVWSNVDTDQHKGVCSICGNETTEAHVWADEGINVTPATCLEPGSETLECLLCLTQKTVELPAKGHAWDNDCDPDCNNAGCLEGRETGHQYADTYSADEKNHWHECSVCGDKADLAAHIPGAAATESTPQICIECEYVIKQELGHVHDFSDEWQQDADYHWHICMKKGCYARQENAAHEYTDECDVTCNVCAHVRVAPHLYSMEWKGSALGHWHDCLICGTQSDILEHIPGDPATQDTPQVCTECQFWIQYPLSHEHTIGETWGKDIQNHWKYCIECSTRVEQSAHNWDEGLVIAEPTETEDGSIRYICKDCDMELVATIPATGSQTDPTETVPVPTQPAPVDPGDTQPPITPPQNDEFPWWILIALAGVLLLTGIILFIIELIRGKKHNSRGKYSR